MISHEPPLSDPIIIKAFTALTVTELYQVLQLRSQVFIIEQDCCYQDLDGLDACSQHAYIEQQQQVIAYLRILPPGTQNHTAALGRIVTHPTHRGQGLCRQLLQQSVQYIQQHYATDVTLSAQTHLTDYYAQFGFVITSDSTMIDGIAHTDMLLKTQHS